jgi:hypothetical protein
VLYFKATEVQSGLVSELPPVIKENIPSLQMWAPKVLSKLSSPKKNKVMIA